VPAIATGAIDVVELSPALEPEYSRFLAADGETMIYATVEYRNFLRDAVGGTPRYLVARAGSRIVGVLPSFVARNERFGTVVNSLPWYGSHGGCQVAADMPEARRELLLAFSRTLAGAASFTTIVLTPAETGRVHDYAAALPDAILDERIGQVTVLPAASADDVERQLEAVCLQKTRNLVRKSRQQGFTLDSADSDAAWTFLHETHDENMRAIGGKAKPWSHFAAMRSNIPPAWRQLLLVTLANQPIAGVLLFRYNRTVEYITPVIKHEFRSLQPLSFAIWHGMINAVRDGFRYWNWGGTWPSQQTLHHFKAGWGASDRPYRYVVQASAAGAEAWSHSREELVAAFPYYFLYPFSAGVSAPGR
jgi:hypothetical protein